jgi:hypothetical protein
MHMNPQEKCSLFSCVRIVPGNDAVFLEEVVIYLLVASRGGAFEKQTDGPRDDKKTHSDCLTPLLLGASDRTDRKVSLDSGAVVLPQHCWIDAKVTPFFKLVRLVQD